MEVVFQIVSGRLAATVVRHRVAAAEPVGGGPRCVFRPTVDACHGLSADCQKNGERKDAGRIKRMATETLCLSEAC